MLQKLFRDFFISTRKKMHLCPLDFSLHKKLDKALIFNSII
jgi:hypothetical protein